MKRPWASASKSAHDAVCLQAGGRTLKLRRAGGNPFHDPELEKLVGKFIEGEGTLLDASTLLLSSWREIDN